MSDQYKTISSLSLGEFRDRGSKFFAYAYPIGKELAWTPHLEEVKKLHPKARHYCYAFRIGLDGNNFRANDDGEPSNSAGRPILGQIDSFGLTNVIIIVVRYFGGTKLGIPGLIHAYKTSTQLALENSDIISKTLSSTITLLFDYSLMSEVMNGVKKLKIKILKQEFTDKGYIKLAIPKSELSTTLIALKAQILKVSIEQARAVENIGGLKIEET